MQIISGESFAEQISAWGVRCSFLDYNLAPQLVKYNFTMQNLLQLAKLKKMTESIKAWSGLDTEIETAQGGFSIVQPLKERQIVGYGEFCDILSTAKPYSVALGMNQNNEPITATLDEMTHIFCGGCTSSGKSVFLNSFIASLCSHNSPKDLQLILCDIKKVEFAKFNRLAHLVLPIANETKTMKSALDYAVNEMEKRYTLMETMGINENHGQFPKLVIVVDELADAVLQNDCDITTPLIRLAQKGRACGIHLCLCTQSIRVKVCGDGLLLANIPTRLVLTCSSFRESVLALGKAGAEKLTGKGDALLKLPSMVNEIRIQVPYISNEDIMAMYE